MINCKLDSYIAWDVWLQTFRFVFLFNKKQGIVQMFLGSLIYTNIECIHCIKNSSVELQKQL